MTVTMFEALDARSQEEPPHDHEGGAHDDVCDNECAIASAVISAEGLE